MEMHISLLMDRPITEKHYISPGSYEFNFNGKNVRFDFFESCGHVCKNPRMIEYTLSDLDLVAFPEAKVLLSKSNLEHVRNIEEIYVFTGESDEPEIYLERVNSIYFELNGETYPVPERVISNYNLVLSGEKKKREADKKTGESEEQTMANLSADTLRFNTICIKEKDIDLGISVDKTFCLKMEEKEIGKGGISNIENLDEITLEWIELLPEYRGKHLLRPALLAVGNYFHVATIVLEASSENADKYLHLGAIKTEYDEFREMQALSLPVDSLKKELGALKTGFFDKKGNELSVGDNCCVTRPCVLAFGTIKNLNDEFCFVEDKTNSVLRLCDLKTNGYEIELERPRVKQRSR